MIINNLNFFIFDDNWRVFLITFSKIKNNFFSLRDFPRPRDAVAAGERGVSLAMTAKHHKMFLRAEGRRLRLAVVDDAVPVLRGRRCGDGGRERPQTGGL